MDKKQQAIDIAKPYTKDAEALVGKLIEAGLVPISYGKAEINTIIEAFKEAFGVTKTTRYDRFAASRLDKAHTAISVVQVIQMLKSASGDRYAPTVNNVSQLEEKWVSIISFLRKTALSNEEIQL